MVTLAHELCNLTKETEWVEFKFNSRTPDKIGEYILALSNSAALAGSVLAMIGFNGWVF